MCFGGGAPDVNSAIVEQNNAVIEQNKVLKEQLNKGNANLSSAATANTTGDKATQKKTVSSLRVPMKNNQGTTGINTVDTTTGLNIPV